MNDQSCVDFLQWALPKMNMRWRGFRKVRRQVCRKVQRRMNELGIVDTGEYQQYLERNPREWQILEGFLPITISRFWRDKRAFELLESRFLPELAAQARNEVSRTLKIWSLGCGAGEEPYTLSILWRQRLKPCFPDVRLDILASDIEHHQLARAKEACYPPSAVKDLPDPLKNAAFDWRNDLLCLKNDYLRGIELEHRDIRAEFPDQCFHLIACRYLAFTYFAVDRQYEFADRLHQSLCSKGLLMLGNKEDLPEGVAGFERVHEQVPIYRRLASS